MLSTQALEGRSENDEGQVSQQPSAHIGEKRKTTDRHHDNSTTSANRLTLDDLRGFFA